MGMSEQLQEAAFAGISFDSPQEVIDKVNKTFPDRKKNAALIKDVQALEGKMKKHVKTVRNLMRKYPRDTGFLSGHALAVDELINSLLGVTVKWNQATSALAKATEEKDPPPVDSP
jgi:hypothetical protein